MDVLILILYNKQVTINKQTGKYNGYNNNYQVTSDMGSHT